VNIILLYFSRIGLLATLDTELISESMTYLAISVKILAHGIYQ